MSAVSIQVFQFYSTKTALRTPRESDGASHPSLTYNLVSALCSLKERLLFVVWQFTLIGMCSFLHYHPLGIALMTRQMTCPVGIQHCVVYMWFHSIASK